jgi:hypothetical protein
VDPAAIFDIDFHYCIAAALLNRSWFIFTTNLVLTQYDIIAALLFRNKLPTTANISS